MVEARRVAAGVEVVRMEHMNETLEEPTCSKQRLKDIDASRKVETVLLVVSELEKRHAIRVLRSALLLIGEDAQESP
jgi:hypothetical protein